MRFSGAVGVSNVTVNVLEDMVGSGVATLVDVRCAIMVTNIAITFRYLDHTISHSSDVIFKKNNLPLNVEMV